MDLVVKSRNGEKRTDNHERYQNVKGFYYYLVYFSAKISQKVLAFYAKSTKKQGAAPPIQKSDAPLYHVKLKPNW